MFIVAASVSMAVIVWFAYVEDMKTSGAWGCAMSWMTPRFVKQTGPPLGNHSRTLDKYDLYLYREDGWDLNDIVRQCRTKLIFSPADRLSSDIPSRKCRLHEAVPIHRLVRRQTVLRPPRLPLN